MGRGFFQKTLKKAAVQGSKRILGGLSLSCIFLLVSLISALFNGWTGFIFLTIFIGAIYFFVRIMDWRNELLADWCNFGKWLHLGIILGTLIGIFPLLKTVYEFRNNTRPKASE